MTNTIINFFSRLLILFTILVIIWLCYFRNTTNIKYSDDALRTNSKSVREKDKIASNSQNRGNSISSNETLNSYLDIKPLQNLVIKDSQNGPIFLSDVNVDDFLSEVKEDNKKWNISSLSIDQVKEITKEKGIVKP